MKFKKVYIEITNKCNLSCSFCLKSNRKLREMSVEEFTVVAKEVKKVTDYVYLHLKGEPLIHSNIYEIVRICKDNNLFVNLTTNATLIKNNLDLFLNEDNFRQVNISLHAYNSKRSLEEIIKIIDIIRKKNSKTYFVYRYWTFNEESAIFKQLLEILSERFDFEYNNMNIKLDERLYLNKDFEFIWPTLDNNIYCDRGSCLGLKTHIGILSDGTVVPCCLDQEGIIDLGNIFEKNINYILDSEKTKKIVNSFKNNKKIEELCKHCSFKI